MPDAIVNGHRDARNGRRDARNEHRDARNLHRDARSARSGLGIPVRGHPPDAPRMRIAYFTESLLPHVDGVSLTLARLFATLEKRAVDFTVFSPFVPDGTVTWHERVRAVRYVRFPPYPDYRVSLPFSPGVGRALADYAPSLIHVVSPTPMAVWAQRQAARLGVPVVASFHTDFVAYFPYYGVRPLEPLGWRYLRWFHSRCARTYVPSPTKAAELADRGIPGIELWTRGIDRTRFGSRFRDDALRRTVAGDADTPIVLLVSRLVREKNLADLIGMDRILKQRGLRYRLALVGDGPMRRELEAALPDACFAGHQTGDALARWYASADVFVFPSTTETFGNVVLEALASGVPAVVVDRGGPQDLILDGETGFVVPACRPDELAGKVERLARDPALRRRFGARAEQEAASRDWDAVNGRLLDSYAEVIAAAR
ncbi:MAG TPA: glycosyltransferase family 1 protein [Gammaproteobacteria bacterium]